MSVAESPVITLLRQQFQGVRQWTEGTIQDVTAEQAHWQPAGRTVSIAAHYAHIITGEDFLFNHALAGGAPVMMSSFAGKTGISEPPPSGAWDEWARRVQVDLPAARAYAQAVYAATDAFLAAQTPDSLNRSVDLSAVGLGQQTVGYVINALLINAGAHTGEMSAIKGLQGLKGYPF